jgi:UMF1 family MFS transporter
MQNEKSTPSPFSQNLLDQNAGFSEPSILNNPKTMRAWTYFDCANSAHSLVIGVAIFPPFFEAIAPKMIQFMGYEIPNSSMLAYALTISYLFIALTQPILSGIADYGGKRKTFMQIFTVLGASACIAMFWMDNPDVWQIGFWAYIVSMIGYAGGVVFNNSFLPLISTPDKFDALSARGFTLGYIGGTLLLIANLVCVIYWQQIGFADEGVATRTAFLMVGLWWLGFSTIPFWGLPNDRKDPLSIKAFTSGFGELKKVWRTVNQQPNIKRFLLAFFFYDAGVQTLIFLAAVFASKVLNFKTFELIALVILLQLVAALGAWIFAKVSEAKGNKWTISVMLVVWTLITFLAFFIQDKMPFYGLGVFLGLVMGGTQSLSRSTYAKLMPKNTTDTTTFYSFYDLTDKIAVVIGTFAFGLIDQLVGIRYSVLMLGFLFLIGLLLLSRVKFDENES